MLVKKTKSLIIVPAVILVLAIAVGLLSGSTLSAQDERWYSKEHNLIRPANLEDDYVKASDKTLACISS